MYISASLTKNQCLVNSLSLDRESQEEYLPKALLLIFIKRKDILFHKFNKYVNATLPFVQLVSVV